MILDSITLTNFRSYPKFSLSFTSPATILIGPNGIGKTNILESIMLISSGSSFRAAKDEEMIQFDQEFSKVTVNTEDDQLQVILTHGSYLGKRTAKKRYLINGVGKRKKDLVAKFSVVLFEPQDLLIILGSPSHRRKYLDSVLSQIDWHYAQALTNYQRGMKQRNKLLYMIREGEASINQLKFWDDHLIKHGQLISSHRQQFIDYLNDTEQQAQFLNPIYKQYKLPKDQNIFTFGYDDSEISRARFDKYQRAEIASATTLVGPHRDELFIYFNQSLSKASKPSYKLISSYGSRGQQRLAILALKLAQANYIHTHTKQPPIILLDDIFSELDDTNDQIVMEIIKNYQSIITTTDGDQFKHLKDVKIIKLPQKSQS